MRFSRRCVVLAALIATAPFRVLGHGGLPIAQDLFERQGVLYLPTMYWGVFFGTDGGPWRWICEEAINQRKDRMWALTGDGTWHVTDFNGITTSRDGGCTWIPATGELAKRYTTWIVADPVDGKRAWTTTRAGLDSPWNGVFTTRDDGASWEAVLEVDEYLRALAISADGMVIYATGSPRAAPDGGDPLQPPWLHVSKDRGKTWSQTRLFYQVGPITIEQIEPLAVDPRDPSVVWLRAVSDPTQAILKGVDYGAKFTVAFQHDGPVGRPIIDPAGDTIDVPVAPIRGPTPPAPMGGVLRSTHGGAFQPVSDLSQSQCLHRIGVGGASAEYACSWNYAPDEKALARSDDQGMHFRKVFQYADTVGPIATCPAGTPVAMTCPGIWQMYADQLGAGGSSTDDAGVTSADMPGPTPPPGCHCSAGGRSRPRGALVGALLLVGAIVERRRRRH